MRIPILLRGALVALIALFGVGLQSANADSGSITLTIYKGGWIIGVDQRSESASTNLPSKNCTPRRFYLRAR